ncbi:MAG: Sec-independent protein translocase TatA [Hirschia sp.]|nr:Sec-independent protein translocase TatA [Hirschia sp.]MBF18393.1 Sec-independent protein translocase TatA [Hirschia sp.]|tara:strand:- start:300 stop:545 length:246 start_codon:yes stop_codon:yes gene_type:complete
MGLGGIHPIQLIIVLVLVLLFFGGRGKISAMMTDLASGVKSFRKGLQDEEEDDKPASSEPKKLNSKGEPINVTPSKDETKV